jgi:glycosyltransferase 2 family protein
MTDPKPQTWKQRGFLFLRILIPLVLIWLLIRNLDWNLVIETLAHFPWWVLGVCILLNFLANVIFAIRWHYLLRTVGVTIPLRYLVSLVFYSLFLSNFLPSTIGGDLVKVAGIYNQGRPEDRAIKVTSVVADRLFSLASKILLFPVVLGLFRTYLPGLFSSPSVSGSVFLWNKIPAKYREKFVHTFHLIKPWFRWDKIGIVLLISWTSLFLTINSFGIAFHQLNPTISAIQVFCVVMLTYFVSILPISINGLGVQEASVAYLLTLVGFTPEQGIAAALINRLIPLVISLLGGAWMLIGGRELLEMVRTRKMDDYTAVIQSAGEEPQE